MQQLEIDYFYPLTDQIPLGLDYKPCLDYEEYKRKESLYVGNRIDKWGIGNPVWVYDNEPRNSEILSRISRVIEMGQKVIIWPSTIKEKDINDMVLSGLNVQSVIESNTYSGLEAKLKFTTWKKI